MAETTVLLAALQDPRLYPHPVSEFRLIETHISWVLLTGNYAYKIKRPVDLGFLDFSTLEKRRFYCEEELRLNRRLAPDLYLDVVPITGSVEKPQLAGTGPVIDYAVKMRQFPPAAQFDALLERNALTASHVEALADAVAAFHAAAPRAAAASAFGTAQTVIAPMLENFRQIRPLLTDADDIARLERIRDWTDRAAERMGAVLAERRDHGFIRECHGDLHLGNVAWIDGKPLIFDCIEFNPALRWIDVISETAFTVMDLISRAHLELAVRFLNRYLEQTGDYAGLALLPLYAVYRALVRCKVECIRASQMPSHDQPDSTPRHRAYMQLAERLMTTRPTPLIITHGLSGSGKTTVSTALCERLGAIRVRSDVERKRLHAMAALERQSGGLNTGIYTAEASSRTYAHLKSLAEHGLDAGFPVVVDAAFLKRDQRERFAALAAQRQIPFVIVDCQSPRDVLEARLLGRAKAATDASDAGLEVLAHQIRSEEPLTDAERGCTLGIDTRLGEAALRSLLQRIAYAVCGASPCL